MVDRSLLASRPARCSYPTTVEGKQLPLPQPSDVDPAAAGAVIIARPVPAGRRRRPTVPPTAAPSGVRSDISAPRTARACEILPSAWWRPRWNRRRGCREPRAGGRSGTLHTPPTMIHTPVGTSGHGAPTRIRHFMNNVVADLALMPISGVIQSGAAASTVTSHCPKAAKPPRRTLPVAAAAKTTVSSARRPYRSSSFSLSVAGRWAADPGGR